MLVVGGRADALRSHREQIGDVVAVLLVAAWAAFASSIQLKKDGFNDAHGRHDDCP